jgi:hypothetical protein
MGVLLKAADILILGTALHGFGINAAFTVLVLDNRGQAAGKNLVHKAVVTVGMEDDFRQSAGKVAVLVIAALVMGMELALGQSADKVALGVIAIFIVGMDNKVHALARIAGINILIGGDVRGEVHKLLAHAALVMLMGDNLWHSASKFTVGIAAFTMYV